MKFTHYAKNRHLRTIVQLCRAISSQLRHVLTFDNRGKKLVKQQYLLHMSSQYGELQPTNGWERLVSLGHTSKVQRVSPLGFVTTSMLLNGGQPNFARCLAISWAHTLYIHFWGLLPCNGILPGANQVLRSPILAALLHGTPAVGISQTLQRDTTNGITELSILVVFNRGCHLFSEGSHHVGHRPTF